MTGPSHYFRSAERIAANTIKGKVVGMVKRSETGKLVIVLDPQYDPVKYEGLLLARLGRSSAGASR